MSSLSPEKEAKKRSKEISKQIKKQAKETKPQIKLLLLGTGECGKSTLLKQMKLIHGDGFPKDLRKDFVGIIRANVITAMTVLYNNLSQFELQLEPPELNTKAETFFEDLNATVTVPPVELFSQLWQSEAIQKAYTRRHQFHLGDYCFHFMSNVEGICASDFVPSDKDILYARKATVGVHEYVFTHKSNRRLEFNMVDVGGQKTERRKWLRCFEDVAGVIFIASLSDFDQMALESEGGENRLKESLTLFKHIAKGKHMRNTPTIVFLNKFDLFKKKLGSGASLKQNFPEYPGKEGDVEEGQKFFRNLFEREQTGTTTMLTTAIDTDLIERIFDQVSSELTIKALNDFNII